MAEGNYLDPACRAAGTTRQVVEYWRKLYEAGAEHAQKYADFFASLARAQSIAEANAVGSVRGGGMGWQGSAWFLERRFPRRWAAVKDRPEKTNSKTRREVVEAAKERGQRRRRDRGAD